MLAPNIEIAIANELVSRIETLMGTCAGIFRRSKGCWTIVGAKSSLDEMNERVITILDGLDLRCESPTVFRLEKQMLVAINVGVDALEPVVVVVSRPDENEELICSLISAHLEALQNRNVAETAKHQSEFFIDQVTQDFEELTWLRTTNEYFDLCDSKYTIDSIAQSCFPTLASVIRAEAILYVSCVSGTYVPDWNCVVSTGCIDDKRESCAMLLSKHKDRSFAGPVVRNCKLSEPSLPEAPNIRNCVALCVSKGQRVYGYIVAVNKTASRSAPPFLEQANSLNPLQFGTFEAGLLSAAANIMASHARNLELLKAQEDLLTGIVRAIINAIDAKDPYTLGHSDRVALYAKTIAAKMGLSTEECERIYMAGLLHDVGKIGVPDSILSKPGALTNEEYAIVQKHPEIGYGILKHLEQLDYLLPGVLHHHEAVNGNGYPCRLVGEAIPLQGRILAVADAYDAMTSDRPYRPGMPSEKAESILRAEAGKTWDSDIVAVLLECVAKEEIRPGSIRLPETHSLDNSIDKSVATSNNQLMRRISHAVNSLVAE